MGSNSTDNINFKVVTPNSAGDRPNSKLFTMTLEKVNKWLDNKKIDPKITIQLKKMAAVYPQQALENWVKNYKHHLTNARKSLKLAAPEKTPELGDELPKSNLSVNSIQLNEAPKIDEFE